MTAKKVVENQLQAASLKICHSIALMLYLMTMAGLPSLGVLVLGASKMFYFLIGAVIIANKNTTGYGKARGGFLLIHLRCIIYFPPISELFVLGNNLPNQKQNKIPTTSKT